MGCVVNGPGEAKEADLGVAGGHGVGIIFKKGELFRKVPESELLEVFLAEIDKMAEEKRADKSLQQARKKVSEDKDCKSRCPGLILKKYHRRHV